MGQAVKINMAGLEVMKKNLENGANWELVKSEDKETIDHKAIPIARIISRG